MFVVQCAINVIDLFILLTEMTETQEIPAQDDPILGTMDIIILIALVIGATYWWFKKNRTEEKPATRSYAIQ